MNTSVVGGSGLGLSVIVIYAVFTAVSLQMFPAERLAEVAEEINWIESRRAEMLDFWKLVEDGIIPTRISHNDTKINNILFDKKGEVLCVIDLDTVMSGYLCYDFGDAVRSGMNTGREDDENLDNIFRKSKKLAF